jgi:hypothetical protein
MALVARGEKNDALRTLELADGGEPLNATDAQSHDLCVEEEAALRKDGAAGTINDAHAAFDGEQSFHLAQHDAKLEGSAMFQLRVAADGIRTVDLTEGNPALAPMGDALKQWKLGQNVPKESRGVVLRLGVLSCNEESGCDFVLTPMDSAAAL